MGLKAMNEEQNAIIEYIMDRLISRGPYRKSGKSFPEPDLDLTQTIQTLLQAEIKNKFLFQPDIFAIPVFNQIFH